jgi:RNA polymerase sigma-70 factor (ECF subfamily)
MSQQSSDENVIDLVARCRAGEQAAATILFRRYIDRLIALVRARLSDRMASRMDPEDVLQSAYRSFFDGLGQGEFSIERADELWGLLAAITLHKLYRKVAYHSAKRRSVQREQSQTRDENMVEAYPELIAELPTPAEAVEAVEELEAVMARLSPQEREILQLRLEGYNSLEIAVRLRRTDRTVRRAMEHVRIEFQRRLMVPDGS